MWHDHLVYILFSHVLHEVEQQDSIESNYINNEVGFDNVYDIFNYY